MEDIQEPEHEDVLGLLNRYNIRMTEETEWTNLGGQNYIASVSWTAQYEGPVTLLIDPLQQGPDVSFSREGHDAKTALENLERAAWQQKWVFPRA